MVQGGSVSRTTEARPNLDWESVRLFLAIMRDRSLARAAERLGVDVSTVSRRLDRLESELGGRLFDRTREGTTPTVLAEQMLPHAEEMELAAARFAAAGAQVETEVEGVVRLTVPPGVADTFVAPALARLHQRHPKLVVELDASIGYANLTRRDADLAIRAIRPASGELVAVKLVTARAAMLASVRYARELGKLKRLEDARWIVWDRDLAHLPDAVWLRKHAPNIVPVLRTSHFASQLSAARAGLGVVISAHPFAIDGLVEVARARALDAAWAELPSGALWLVGHRALRHVPRVAAVWDFIVETIAGDG
jgi:DNA-binding transcriptional LysR family regulator